MRKYMPGWSKYFCCLDGVRIYRIFMQCTVAEIPAGEEILKYSDIHSELESKKKRCTSHIGREDGSHKG